MATIVLSHPFWEPVPACEQHDGLPLHVEAECGLVAGIDASGAQVRCSVCDQEWGEGVVSRHESCAFVFVDDGREWRKYAEPITVTADGTIITYG